MDKPGQLTAMISSTAFDLPEHRKNVAEACLSEEVFPLGMERLPARDATGVHASLEMVDRADIYIGVYAWRYGWIPDAENAAKLSITEMEFNRALERKSRGELKEILIFVMHDDHPTKRADIEADAVAQEKLQKLKERASTGRVQMQFKSPEELRGQVIQSLAAFKRRHGSTSESRECSGTDSLPKPPAFYAEPSYIGSHSFIGRKTQLATLSAWALPSDPNTILLFEAIGGNGKSMLTWEWTLRHAPNIRPDWSGYFWYSFYEKGAVMADFCQHALAYMTGQPLEQLHKKKTPELAKELIHQLRARPWLLILDGLERVLVAYHRIDAAEVPDEEANRPTDKIVDRDPCSAIRDEDDDLLRSLAAAAPSKILVSSRLIPRVLMNAAGQPIPGVRPIELPGLDAPDAEALLRSCGVSGDSAAIRSYLKANCDNHPLVIGTLAGLINDYLPDRGNFDAWAADPEGGGQLNMALLDLIQRRNHILLAAIAALPNTSRQLLSTLALLSESVDDSTLVALNPHLPPEPEEVHEPTKPEASWRWERMSESEKAEAQRRYDEALLRRKDYEQAVKARLESAAYRTAPSELTKTLRDLKRRGLLQYDGRTKRFDLHPVVRGVAAGNLRAEDRERYGQRVVDHFSRQSHNPYEKAETLDDVRIGLNLVRTLVKIGHFQQAADTFRGSLADAMRTNLEAHSETLSLLRPFFSGGWGELPSMIDKQDGAYLANDAAIALSNLGELNVSLSAYGAALSFSSSAERWYEVGVNLRNISRTFADMNKLADWRRMLSMALDLATVTNERQALFVSRLELFVHYARTGQWTEAEATWQLLDPMGRSWARSAYRPGRAEWHYAVFQFWRGQLQEEHLALAARLTKEGNNRIDNRRVCLLHGEWRLEQGDWAQATAYLQEAVRLSRERGIADAEAETGLALAKAHLGLLADPQREAERLAQLRPTAHRYLASLWLTLGNSEQAQEQARAAYQYAWADGEPFVNRYELTQTNELLRQLGLPIPNLPPCHPAREEKLPWEESIVAAIEKLRAKAITRADH